ncbi:MAG: DUF2179 domain-containing protein [Anaerolineae bacterium]|nr:MAG: DUF2179 domain-containing protein [Anaerolineae bacterium]
MPSWLPLSALLSALLIFALRVTDMTLDTLRVLSVMRGKRAAAWGAGFFQASFFVIAFSTVLKNLDNPLNIVGYAAGFATGNVVGIMLENKLAPGILNVRVISPRRGTRLAEELRAEGFAVTEMTGRGKDGTVDVLHCTVRRKELPRIEALVHTIDPEAFVVSEDIRSVRRGFWRA